MKQVMRWALGAAATVTLSAGAAAQLIGTDAEAFMDAIREQDGAKAEMLVTKQGSSVLNYRSYNGETPLTAAMAKRSGTYVGFLLQRGANPNISDKRGDTALIIAARSGFMEGVDRMLGARASVDAANRQGETALIVAVQGRHARIVRLLLEAGANPDRADIAAGYSARDYARRDSRNRELLRLIESVRSKQRAEPGPKAQ